MSQPPEESNQSSLDPCLPSIDNLSPLSFNQSSIDTGRIFAKYEQVPSYHLLRTSCTDFADRSESKFPFSDLEDDATSGTPTPELVGYTSNHPEHSPPPSCHPSAPAPSSPHPYDRQLQQHQPGFVDPNSQFHQSILFQSAANNNLLLPPVQYLTHVGVRQTFRRQSLSQGDAERITTHMTSHVNCLRDPRKQTSRSKSATPERYDSRTGRYRKVPKYEHHNRKTKSRVPTTKPIHKRTATVSIQYPAGFSRHGVPIGTPLNDVEDTSMDTPDQFSAPPSFPAIVIGNNNMCAQLTGPRLKHMSHEEQINKSLNIIEIGAMAVINKSKRKPPRPLKEKDELLRMVAKIEEYLKAQALETTVKGLMACEIVRETLT